jgi:glycogen synthase
MKILHVLHHSAPYLDGYGVRSKYIVDAQRALGLDPVIVTSAHHEIEVRRDDPTQQHPAEHIDGTLYHRTPAPAPRLMKVPVLRERALMSALGRSIEKVIADERPDLIHAHSPVLCGLPALKSARRHRLPLVYEVRAFWEDALLTSTRSPVDYVKYRYSRALETRVLTQADAVVGISRHIVADVAGRGVDAARLLCMPNGVDTAQFTPTPRDPALVRKLELDGRPTVGFIGSFFDFEGIDDLVRAMPAVLSRQPEARLVLIGTGEAEAAVRDLIAALELQNRVLQLGRVPHSDILRYYALMDVLVYPRRRVRITELVTPLKPLEAMAAGKAVVGSDVGGIVELLDDGRAGRLFKAGDHADLADRIIELLGDPAAREALAARGREYVLKTRQWQTLVRGYLPVYDRLLATPRQRIA